MSTTILPELEQRRARRGLRDTPLDSALIERLFQAATLAPSCNNKQPWRFLALTEPEALEKGRAALLGGNYWAKVAPMLVVVCTRDEYDCQLNDDRNYAQFDAGMAVLGLLLQATREGLYAHPMAGFDPGVLREQFAIEPETRVITMIAIGHPGDGANLNEKHAASEVSERNRLPLDQVLKFQSWNG